MRLGGKDEEKKYTEKMIKSGYREKRRRTRRQRTKGKRQKRRNMSRKGIIKMKGE